MRISDWSADVCSSDLRRGVARTRTEGALMRLKPIIPALLASALMAGPAFAQAEGPSQRTLGTTTDGKRIVSMVIYGEDPCPEGKDGEIVVCSRQPERDRYRRPKTFRRQEERMVGKEC